jgi:ComF family protein
MGAMRRAPLRAIGAALLDVVIPPRCGVCGRFDRFLCAACEASLPVAAPPRCPTCWSVPDERGRCRPCAALLGQPLAGVRSAYLLDGPARRLVHALKYEGHAALAEPMGRLLAEPLLHWGIRPDLIAPAPLHPGRERRRGFNQAALLVRACAGVTDIPAGRPLRRIRPTPPQVRMASSEARRENVAGAFVAEGVAGRAVLVVDDVCTTGATLRACAEALRRAGAARVYGLTFAHGV